MNFNVLFSVFRRNFVSYFANPTGYLFICLFVWLGAIAAFWVPAFFSNNLANLEQLNFWFPFIMLVYIPSITMGVWADERKQGTDELLLTIPAGDFEIVLGKYLAAVAIYTVALLFSLACNFAVLAWLGNPDAGLFIGNYVGYWFVGLAMISIGVVASFLAGNITISFVLGALFNSPLVFLVWADAILGGWERQKVAAIQYWSISRQFADFGRGIISLASVVYFLMIVVVMLYLSMVLIGRRHWFSGRHRWARTGHYIVRALSLAIVVVGAVLFFRHHDVRYDATAEKLSSLSRETRDLIAGLDVERPVEIEAFVSPAVPEPYRNTRLNLLNVLREMQALGGKKLTVKIHDTERFSQEATLAEDLYGIEPQRVPTFNRGEMGSEDIFLNVAVRCGMRKVPPLFINRGVPVEYELVRSICTVSEEKRLKLGVLETDAKLFGGFDMQAMSASPNSPLIDELEKQYEVDRVDPTKPITEKYDVLLAVQPSSLGPEELENLIAAIAAGQPTAIFEDPAPLLSPGVPGTSAPRMSPGNMFMPSRPLPKGDIQRLWNLLGVAFPGDRIVWQDYNPYPRFTSFESEKEFVFVDTQCENAEFGDDPISSGLQQIVCPFPGYVDKLNTSELKFLPLVRTGQSSGDLRYRDVVRDTPRGPQLQTFRPRDPSGKSYILAARVQGKTQYTPPPELPGNLLDDKPAEEKQPVEANLNVVVVADMDLFSQPIFQLREQGDMPEIDVYFRFDNVPFVLNILDELAGEERFIAIRNRRPSHRTLVRIDQQTQKSRKEVAEARTKFSEDYKQMKQDEEVAMETKLAELQQRKNIDAQQLLIELGMMKQNLERIKEAKLNRAEREMNRKIRESEISLNQEVKRVQDRYKLWAVLLPPIPPLVVALIVFLIRRVREREGVARSRLR
ncbi:MAG: ABC transporter permease [Pirellulaceae bacterium]|nr:ABC transporter permease [Pirellulaceae bacterium]